MPNIGTLGALFSGFTQGAQTGIELGFKGEQLNNKREQLALQRQIAMRNARKQDLEFMLKTREMLDEAMSEPNEQFRNAAIDSTLRAIEGALNIKAPKELVRLFHDPESGPAILSAMKQTGITMENLFKATGTDPLITSQLLLSFGKASRERRFAQAAGGQETPTMGLQQPNLGSGSQTTPLPPQPTIPTQPLGGGAQPAVAAQPRPGGTQASTAPLQADVDQRRAELATLQNRRAAILSQPGIDPRRVDAAIRGIDEQIKNVQASIDKITVEPELARQTELRQPTPEPVLEFSRGMLVNSGRVKNIDEARKLLPPGLSREEYQNFIRSSSIGSTSDVTPSDRIPLSEPEKTEAKIKAETAANEKRVRAETAIKSAFKTFDDIKETATRARDVKDIVAIGAAAAQNVGITGPWISAVRGTINNLAQTVGVKQPAGMQEMELIRKTNAQLATFMTQMQKGQQSDKELFLALSANPGLLNSPKGLAVMLFTTKEMANKSIMYEAEARAWQAKNRDLDSPDERGFFFQDVFEAKMRNFNRQNGTIAERVGKAFEIDHKQLLKGIIRGI